MKDTETRVKNRTKWNDLNNIQMFSGKDNFSFAFKKLNSFTEVGRLFCDILSNNREGGFVFEPDFYLNYYFDYRVQNLLAYDSMPEEFYLRKIYHYANFAKRKFGDETPLTFEQVIQKTENDSIYNHLLYNMLRIKIYNNQRSLAKISKKEMREKIDQIKKNQAQFDKLCNFDDLRILQLFYETKTFDKGSGRN